MYMPLILLSFFGLINHAYLQELFGASVNWRPISNNSIALTYRLIWENLQSVEHFKNNSCTRPSVTSRTACELGIDKKFRNGLLKVQSTSPIFQGFKWLCLKGCYSQGRIVSNMSELYFTESGARFFDDAWESGVETVDMHFSTEDDIDDIKIGFTYSNGTLANGLGEAHVTVAWRNDTMKPNISPLLNVFPVYRVPLGCSIVINLFPFDGDGDKVTCHWQTFPEKNSSESRAVLNSHFCEIVFTADSNKMMPGDVVYLSLYAEDFSHSPVELNGASRYVTSGPFCRTPIKIRVSIGNATSSCQSKGPLFDNLQSMKSNLKHSYEAGNLTNGIETDVAFKIPDESCTILTSGPRYMIFTTERNETLITFGVWENLHDVQMKGIHQVCGMAYASDGTPGESRCAVLLIYEPDECSGPVNPCGEGGICDNFFEHYTCSYEYVKVTDIKRLSGSHDCGTTITKGNDGLKIGLPVGLFLLLLLLIIAVMLYLKHKWTERMQTVDVGDETKISALAGKAIDN